MRKGIVLLILAAFLTNTFVPYTYAQAVLPDPGVRLALSPIFTPPLLKGVKVYPNDPFRLDFILDKGDGLAPQEEANRLIKYFLAALTVPEKDLWVNLSPYEKNRIVPDAFGETEMGRDLLAQDYILKQITASLLYPEGAVGKEFWAKTYQQAQEKFGTSDIPVDTFNKVWIVPEKATVYENKDAAFVVESHLKVMLESDYLAMDNDRRGDPAGRPNEGESPTRPYNTSDQEFAKDVLRSVVIPVLEKEVNEGKNFAQLRQVYYSLILATWFKDKIRQSLLGRAYVDQQKISGIDIADKTEKEKIWTQYVAAFRKGVFNFVQEEPDGMTGEMIPRKYFSGGMGLQLKENGSYRTTTGREAFPKDFSTDDAEIIEFKGQPFDAAQDQPDPAVARGRFNREAFNRGDIKTRGTYSLLNAIYEINPGRRIRIMDFGSDGQFVQELVDGRYKPFVESVYALDIEKLRKMDFTRTEKIDEANVFAMEDVAAGDAPDLVARYARDVKFDWIFMNAPDPDLGIAKYADELEALAARDAVIFLRLTAMDQVSLEDFKTILSNRGFDFQGVIKEPPSDYPETEFITGIRKDRMIYVFTNRLKEDRAQRGSTDKASVPADINDLIKKGSGFLGGKNFIDVPGFAWELKFFKPEKNIRDVQDIKEIRGRLDLVKSYKQQKFYARLGSSGMAGFAGRKVVYNPLGGMDVVAPFSLAADATDVVSVGLHSFGAPEAVLAHLRQLTNPDEASLRGQDFDRANTYSELEEQYGGIGALALAKIVRFLGGTIKGLYYFDLDPDGKVRFAAQAGKDERHQAAVAEFTIKGPDGGAVTKRFWYIQQDLLQEGSASYDSFREFISVLDFDALMIKGAYSFWSDKYRRVKVARVTLDPALHRDVAVLSDRKLEGKNESQDIWKEPPQTYTLQAGELYGYSSNSLQDKVYYGPSSLLKSSKDYAAVADESAETTADKSQLSDDERILRAAKALFFDQQATLRAGDVLDRVRGRLETLFGDSVAARVWPLIRNARVIVSGNAPVFARTLVDGRFSREPVIVLNALPVKAMSDVQLLYLLGHELGHLVLDDMHVQAQEALRIKGDLARNRVLLEEIEKRADLLGLALAMDVFGVQAAAEISRVPLLRQTYQPDVTRLQKKYDLDRSLPFDPHMDNEARAKWLQQEISLADGYNDPADHVASLGRKIFTDKDDAQTGGIDLTPGKNGLNVQSTGSGVSFDFDPRAIRAFQNASGITPVIISIHPMTISLPKFMGVSDNIPLN